MKLDIKFPCGYEMSVTTNGVEYYQTNLPTVCPLHGKDCPPK